MNKYFITFTLDLVDFHNDVIIDILLIINIICHKDTQ